MVGGIVKIFPALCESFCLMEVLSPPLGILSHTCAYQYSVKDLKEFLCRYPVFSTSLCTFLIFDTLLEHTRLM